VRRELRWSRCWCSRAGQLQYFLHRRKTRARGHCHKTPVSDSLSFFTQKTLIKTWLFCYKIVFLFTCDLLALGRTWNINFVCFLDYNSIRFAYKNKLSVISFSDFVNPLTLPVILMTMRCAVSMVNTIEICWPYDLTTDLEIARKAAPHVISWPCHSIIRHTYPRLKFLWLPNNYFNAFSLSCNLTFDLRKVIRTSNSVISDKLSKAGFSTKSSSSSSSYSY